MAGTITHKWDGTVLTVTSDSGTSSADLKGAKGDDGARGAVGACPTLSVNGKIGEVVLNADDVGAVRKTGDTMTGDLHIADSCLYADSLATNSTDEKPLFALIYGGNDSATFQVNNADWSCDNHLRLYKDRTVLGKPLAIGSGGTGQTTLSGFQSQAMYAQYMHTPTENVLTLPNGYYHIEGVVSKETNGFPYDSTDTRAEVTVFGNRNGENGYYCVCVIEMWGGTIYINRRTWSSWSGWTKITPTAV